MAPVRGFEAMWERLSVADKRQTMANSENVAAPSQVEGLFGAVDGAVGLGVDIVEIERMRKILKRSPAFARKVFSCEECCYCDATSQPEVHYATRFAAKEAVLKALGTGFSEGIGVRDAQNAKEA